MGMTFFSNVFEKWATRTPDGRPFVDPPWECYSRANRVPFYLAPYKTPVRYIFIVALCIALLSFVVSAKIVFPVSSAVLAVLYVAMKDSWHISSSLTVGAVTSFQKVSENQSFKIHLRVENRGSYGPVDGALYFEFLGSSRSKNFVVLPDIDQGNSFDVKIDLPADAGMGLFDVQNLLLITSDRFGIFSRCVKQEISLVVEVCPEYIPMPPFRLHVAGRATHLGTIEGKISGDSTSFLGVRDFRVGDNIRRIDWRRSARHSSLIVRDFEKLNSTDATVFVDNRSIGVFEFDGLNSYEHLKESVISLCRALIDQGVRVQVIIQDGRLIPFASGHRFFEELVEVLRNLKPDGGGSIVNFLSKNKELVPPDSVVIPVFSAVDIDPVMVREIFYGWNSMRCEVVPVIIDTPRFERHVVKSMESFSQKKMDLTFFRQIYMGASDDRMYENISRKIYENTIVIGPGERIGAVYSRMYS